MLQILDSGVMLAIVAPGQGAQRHGLLTPWLELAGVREHLAELSDAAEIDLLEVGTTWDAAALRPTEIAQPLVVASALVSARILEREGIRPDVVAGHSVGEWAAAVLAGVLTETDAMRLVAVRGRSMAQACGAASTGMAAVLGGDRDEVLSKLNSYGLTAANDNGGGQIVAAGPTDALEAFVADAPAGARVRRLEVSGAFHTSAMKSAIAPLAKAAGSVTSSPANIAFLSNCDGGLIDAVVADGGIACDGSEILARLVNQVVSPVRWDLCTNTLRRFGITTLIELAPAGTLSGLAKRALPGVRVVALNTPGDLDSVRGRTASLSELASDLVSINSHHR